MKRCPECRRDYYDDTLSFCLSDGTKLVYGLPEEPPKRRLSRSAGSSPLDSSKDRTAEKTALFPTEIVAEPRRLLEKLPKSPAVWNKKPTDTARVLPTSSHRSLKTVAALTLIIVVLVGGFFGYRYFSPTRQIDSIAVMPFVNDSGNVDAEYLSEGMTETLIKSLSQVPNLAVKSRSTVFYYKGKDTSPKKIGEELAVQAVLLGRVGGRGEDVKLNLELVNTQTQDVIWTEHYDRKHSDLVSLQSEIAREVSTKLKLKLSGADEAKITKNQTASPEAFQAYLKGRYYWNRRTSENFKKAMEEFRSATERDPNYALAYTGLADCYNLLNQYTGAPMSETLPQAKAFAERAIALDDQLAEPHASLGLAYENLWQFAESEREFKRSIELNPNYATAFHWYSILLRTLGRYDEAALMIKRAKDLDPLSSIIGISLSHMYQLQNDHNASIENSLKVIDLDPNFSGAYNALGFSYLRLGRNAEAIANLEKAVELSNRASLKLMDLGYGYAVVGKRSEANAIVKELEERYARKEAIGQNVAAVYAGLGNKDKVYEWLEKDFQTKSELVVIRWVVPFESFRDDARFKDLLKRMGLPE